MQSDLHETFQKAVLQRGGAPEQGGLLEGQAVVNVKLKWDCNHIPVGSGRHPQSPHEQEAEAVQQPPSLSELKIHFLL